MNKTARWILILGSIILFVVSLPRILVLGIAAYQYFQTEIVCTGLDPTPPNNLGKSFPMPIYEVDKYKVVNDQGTMLLGDEYIVSGEGVWRGMSTLIWSGPKGAYFTVTFESALSGEDYSREHCKWYLPIGDYR